MSFILSILSINILTSNERLLQMERNTHNNIDSVVCENLHEVLAAK